MDCRCALNPELAWLNACPPEEFHGGNALSRGEASRALGQATSTSKLFDFFDHLAQKRVGDVFHFLAGVVFFLRFLAYIGVVRVELNLLFRRTLPVLGDWHTFFGVGGRIAYLVGLALWLVGVEAGIYGHTDIAINEMVPGRAIARRKGTNPASGRSALGRKDRKASSVRGIRGT